MTARTRGRRAVLLVMVLLLTSLLSLLALGFLGSQGPEAQRAAEAVEAAQAHELARSGIEDARVKFVNDLEYPPFSRDQSLFSYSETRPGVGSYRVTLDCSRHELEIFEIRSEGWVGPASAPRAVSRVTAWVRGNQFEVLRWDE